MCLSVFYQDEINDTNNIQYFVMHGLGLCIKSYVAHMLYAWYFIHNTEVPIAIKKNNYYLSLNT